MTVLPFLLTVDTGCLLSPRPFACQNAFFKKLLLTFITETGMLKDNTDLARDTQCQNIGSIRRSQASAEALVLVISPSIGDCDLVHAHSVSILGLVLLLWLQNEAGFLLPCDARSDKRARWKKVLCAWLSHQSAVWKKREDKGETR